MSWMAVMHHYNSQRAAEDDDNDDDFSDFAIINAFTRILRKCDRG